MKRIRRWLGLGLVLLVGGMILAAFLEPTQTVPGYLAGDSFYRSRPTRYWRECLRADGRYGSLSSMNIRQFRDTSAAFSVLRQCASDPDRNVRWAAIALLGRGDGRSEEILSVLVNILDDEDMGVCLTAIRALDHWGPMARSAVPALAKLLKDPEEQIALFADIALWDIDQSAAWREAGWKPFRSDDWKFTVMLPSEPEHTEQPFLFISIHSFMAMHKAGPYNSATAYDIGVSEYPAEFLEGKNKEDILAKAMDDTVKKFGGKLIDEKPIEQNGWKGMEHRIEVEGKGTYQRRIFWVDNRLYQLGIGVGKPEYLNVRAADYFLESFQVDKSEEK